MDLTHGHDWEEKYQRADMPWDLGMVSPPFVHMMTHAPLSPGRLAIPGAGRGHEAIYFAKLGFDVTTFDISVTACELLRDRARSEGVDITVSCKDALALPDRFHGVFDYVLEQTFFCAINPRERPRYVTQIHAMLKPKGQLFGVFMEVQDPNGPPFGTNAKELERLFSPLFEIRVLARCQHSHPRRAGRELWAELVPRSSSL